MTKWAKKLLIPPNELRGVNDAFTLDQDGGLVVSLDAVVRSEAMQRQLQAAQKLRAKKLASRRRKEPELATTEDPV